MITTMIDYKVTLGVIGSRKFDDYKYLKDQCDRVEFTIVDRLFEQGAIPTIHVISGGAKGADTLAERWAKEEDYPFTVYLPAFEEHGTPYRKADYYDRDVRIAANCNVLIAFLVKQTGKNRGSRITIKAALDTMKEVHVFYK